MEPPRCAARWLSQRFTASGVTTRDVELARAISALARKVGATAEPTVPTSVPRCG